MAKQEESFGKSIRDAEQLLGLTKQINKSMSSYGETLIDIAKLTKQLKSFNKKISEYERKIKQTQANINRLKKIDTDEAKKKLKLQEEMLKNYQKEKELLDEYAKGFEDSIEKMKKATNVFKAFGNTVKDVSWRYLKKVPGYFTEQDKEIRKAAVSIGIMSKESNILFRRINKAALSTLQFGVNMKGLAKLQSDFSHQVGRTIFLTENGLKAVAALQEGAFGGDAGITAEFLSTIENFGYAAEKAKDLLEEGVNTATSMGINASKYSKEFVNNLKISQKYNFKRGIRDLKAMTAESIKFKMEMQDVADFAEKIMNPEGAVEMAAKLQVLGGQWAKLGDAFTLLYQSRHDIAGLQKSIIKAAAGTAQWNEELGQFDISAMEMQRLREIANATGLDFEKLTQRARDFAKFSKIRANITPKFSKEAKEFIESTAQWDSNEKTWKVQIMDKNYSLKELNQMPGTIENLIADHKKTLEQIALMTQTFNDTLNNLIEMGKTFLIPFLKGLDTSLTPILKEFVKGFGENNTFTDSAQLLFKAGEKFGEFLSTPAKWISNLGGSLATVIGGSLAALGIFKAASWFMNGIALGKGFLATTGGKTGIGGGLGSPYSLNTLKRGKNGQYYAKGRRGAIGKNDLSFMQKANARFNSSRIGKNFKGLTPGKAIGLGVLGDLGAMGLSYGREQLDDPNSGLGQAMNIGSGALSWGSQGLMLGTMLGGPIGAAIGGIGGALVGGVKGYLDNQEALKGRAVSNIKSPYQDFISRPGQPVEPISTKDTIIGAKHNGPIDKILKGNETNESKNITIDFNPIKIEGDIKINGQSGLVDITKDPHIMRELSELIQIELRKAIGGGKLNPNPI